ncbi:hypothetical protein J6590_069096 [Homalodisca vitripennis]|nr:hypothetical protein J6590_069096 [Homalodisca vitripennis]
MIRTESLFTYKKERMMKSILLEALDNQYLYGVPIVERSKTLDFESELEIAQIVIRVKDASDCTPPLIHTPSPAVVVSFIGRVDQYNYLEIFFDNQLNWAPRIQYVKKKIFNLLFSFNQLSGILSGGRFSQFILPTCSRFCSVVFSLGEECRLLYWNNLRSHRKHILGAEGGSVAEYKRRMGQWLLNLGDAASEALIRSRYR